MKCQNCSRTNPEDARFCQNCGQPLERGCANCGTLNPTAASFCQHCGKSLSGQSNRLGDLRHAAPRDLRDKFRAASAELEGQRKPVTILFTDIVGSTALAEKLDPEEWREIVSGAHQRVSEAIYRYEGTIAQLLGDGVLAFFGAPITHEDDPVRAVRAGLDIQASIEDYARDLKGYVDNFQLRVGINTGTVVVGSVGNDMHMEYLAIGDAVNLAARLQSEARPGRVLISDATGKLVKSAFDLADQPELRVKGKAEPVTVFEVTDRKAIPSPRRGIEGLVAPLVGRGEDLAALRTALTELAAGHGQIVAILGEAGIGKSRLIEEARLDPSIGSLRWLEGRSLSYGGALPFWAITQLIKNDLGLSDGDPEVRIKAALRKRLSGLLAGGADEVFPYLAHLVGVKLDDQTDRRLQSLDGETLKRQVLRSAAEYFQHVAAEQPTVLVLEDLHWADPSTLEALEILLPLTDRSPLGLVLVARIEHDHGSWWLKLSAETNYAHRFTQMQLKPLTSGDSNELVTQLLVEADLPDRIRELILEHAEGNPFYLEEVIRSLIEQGALAREGTTWKATAEIDDVEIPATLQGVLLARIDRLQEDVRRTLQLASVIGRTFLYRLLDSIALAERELDKHLSVLQRADLVHEKSRRPELEYIFKHSLTQEAAYDSLLLERRKEFHRRVGEALEQLFADRQEEFYGLLAHHFDAAGERGKAIDYWIKAGDTARESDATEEAIQDYQHAIRLQEEVGEAARLSKTWLKLGLVHQVNFRFEQAHEANERAFAIAARLRAEQAGAAPREHARAPHPMRLSYHGPPISSLDPWRIFYTHEFWITNHIIAGLVELDADANVVPHIARSWEVLDGGTRYVFHLRDDVSWTDGTQVTAHDFEWSMKRYIAPGTTAAFANESDDILGAVDFRQGRNPDPDSVGVLALDDLTFEVRLRAPVAYFLYLMAMPGTWALPRAVLEKHGDDWWKPEHIVSNGPFQLVEFDEQRCVLQRNPAYFGEFPGNLDRLECTLLESPEAAVRAYVGGQADFVPSLKLEDVPPSVPPAEVLEGKPLVTFGLNLVAPQPPMDNLSLRRAIAHALDRRRLADAVSVRVPWTGGGIIPPGIAGHSPELGLEFDVEKARKLLAEAGYPKGSTLPPLQLYFPAGTPARMLDEFEHELRDHLGIRVELRTIPTDGPWWMVSDSHLQFGGWIVDYPDPDNVLRASSFVRTLTHRGWRHARLEQLLEEAGRTADRARRLAMYREADRIMVNDEVVVVPLAYHEGRDIELRKPWIGKASFNRMGQLDLREVVIASH